MKHWNNIAKSLLFTLALALAFGIALIGTSPALATGGTLTGNGTTDDPYQIADAADLKAFANIVNGTNGATKNTGACAILTGDIDLSTVCSENKGSWTPIGTNLKNFIGTFNGDNHTIKGLYIKNTLTYQGLFGGIGPGGTVQNLTVFGEVTAKDFVGGVVGFNNGGTVTSCTNSGTVTATGNAAFVGGVVGNNISSTVTNCYNTGDVIAQGDNSHAGGVVGNNYSGTITNCYNTGMVETKGSGGSAGGVVGYNFSGTVTNCINTDTGTVKVEGSSSYAGGVVGCINCDGISNCYNTGMVEIKGSGGSAGGVVGYNKSGTITKCYYLADEESDDLKGIGSGSGDVNSKTSKEFASGEVAWLLQYGQTSQVWGQTLSGNSADPYPVLTVFDKDAPQVYKVTFMNSGQEYSAGYANSGGTVTKPADPTRAGYNFEGWYSDENFNTAWSFNSDTVSKDMALYAKWNKNQYTVTFESNGGSAVDSQIIKYGDTVTEPDDPTRTGYTFDGWYSDAPLTTAWIFDSNTVSKDMTLYAKWKVKQYTVTFESNNGSVVEPKTIAHGEKVTQPADPTRAGYTFAGWYSDVSLTTLWDFDTVITDNITLYAKWTENRYTVTFNSNDGTAVESL